MAASSPLDEHTSPVTDHRTAGGAVKSGKATASMIVGIVGLVLIFAFWPVGIITCVVGLILGIIARGEARRMGANNGGMALAGIITSAIGIGLFVVLFAIGAAIVAGSN